MNVQQQFKSIVDQLEGAAIVDRQGRYVYANAGWERHMRLSFAEIKGRAILEVVKKTRAMEAMDTGKPIWGNFISSNGNEMFSNYTPIFDGDTVVGCFVQIMFGIEDALLFSDQITRVKNELAYYKNQLRDIKSKSYKYSIESIAGNSPAIQKMKKQIRLAANSLSTVLIIGETGSGKELVAHSIHNLSQRQERPFVKINCAAIPPDLAESEFFGYEYGAFTGAKKGGKEGMFELASGGSLFLDEINQMSYFIQPKILRVLQEREVNRVGGAVGIPVDVRVIAASNQPLEPLVAESKFRQDLFYRLNVVRIQVPPLRERLEDIPALLNDIIGRLNYQLGLRVEGVTSDVYSYFQSYDWPGNIRELQNVVEQAMNMKGSGLLDMDCFDSYFSGQKSRRLLKGLGEGTLERQKRELERILITDAYKKFKKNKRQTAEYLGISRPMLYQRLKEFNLID